MTLTEEIKSKAIQVGFDKVGIAPASILSTEGDHLKEWLGRGYQASMGWMERNIEKRIDVSTIVSNARSVIAVALNYYTPVHHHPTAEQGKISRYAWGDDYHDVMDGRIQSLFECIKQLVPECNGRYYVDTGPVMDKAWAARAGIGWQGKHTNIITKEYGSWVFLGEIITDLELEYDTPMEDFCGTCTACIDACPTDAIREPYIVDSNRCISYLTIEHRTEIDPALGAKFDQWVYGCDICQDVCPWNRFQQPTPNGSFLPREHAIDPPLKELEELSQEEFSRRFRNSPVKRTKRTGLARNASVVRRKMEQRSGNN